MIIWQGNGWLAALIAAVVFLASLQLENAKLLATPLIVALIPIVTGALVVLLAHYFEKNDPEQILINQRTGLSEHYKRKHTLMFIPIKWIGYFCLFIGALLLAIALRG